MSCFYNLTNFQTSACNKMPGSPVPYIPISPSLIPTWMCWLSNISTPVGHVTYRSFPSSDAGFRDPSVCIHLACRRACNVGSGPTVRNTNAAFPPNTYTINPPPPIRTRIMVPPWHLPSQTTSGRIVGIFCGNLRAWLSRLPCFATRCFPAAYKLSLVSSWAGAHNPQQCGCGPQHQWRDFMPAEHCPELR
ncbi:uncharacterized protein BCR38DRAFT_38827 [Pseudomassariella vexata]|uniref:Uncharacterized protein n=1 Tax=Pseudomassariella vexata TaxID=1141098 RepID=A0A1Y2DSU1_9PEZI|nr:uncharacterized protein BCR38DRAFT_38827 [Pseudomassariella vexata]ORY61725.1 hypothetical protein BCR38DRAFT_38827 [Pseudomassariella vexata]